VKGLEQSLIFGETTPALVDLWGEGAFLLLCFFKVNLGDLDPTHLCLVISKPVKYLLLLEHALLFDLPDF
jgi:hypothetical protein